MMQLVVNRMHLSSHLRCLGRTALLAVAMAVPLSSTAETVALVGARPASSPSPVGSWTLKALPEQPVPFHGILNMDNAGMGASPMFYPGGHPFVAIAAVAAHALISSNAQAREKTQLQTAADQVLTPYREILASFKQPELQERAIALLQQRPEARVHSGAETAPAQRLVEATPMFFMTPEGSALVLDAMIAVQSVGDTEPLFQQLVRVVSRARTGDDLIAQWSANGGAALKATAAEMLAQSLQIAVAQAARPMGDQPLPHKTIRYHLGRTEVTERAQLVEQNCERVLIRSLRGELFSVPQSERARLPAGCPAPAVAPVNTPATQAARTSAQPAPSASAAAS